MRCLVHFDKIHSLSKRGVPLNFMSQIAISSYRFPLLSIGNTRYNLQSFHLNESLICVYTQGDEILRTEVLLCYFFFFPNIFFSSLAMRRSTFLTSSAGGSFSGIIPRSVSILRTAALLSTCSLVMDTSP